MHVEAVAGGIGKQALPVGIGVAFVLRAEIALLGGTEEVYLHLGGRLPTGGVIVDVAIALVGGLDDVDTVLQRIGAGGKDLGTEVANLQRHGLLADALDEDEHRLAFSKRDARRVLMVIIGVAVLQFALQVAYGTEGRELAQAELRAIGAGQHLLGRLAHLADGNLFELLGGDTGLQLRAERIGKVLAQDVAHVVVGLEELHLGTGCIAARAVVAGSALHDEAHGSDIVDAVVAEGYTRSSTRAFEIISAQVDECRRTALLILHLHFLEVAVGVAVLARIVNSVVHVRCLLELVGQRDGEVGAVVPRRVIVGCHIAVERLLDAIARLHLRCRAAGHGNEVVAGVVTSLNHRNRAHHAAVGRGEGNRACALCHVIVGLGKHGGVAVGHAPQRNPGVGTGGGVVAVGCHSHGGEVAVVEIDNVARQHQPLGLQVGIVKTKGLCLHAYGKQHAEHSEQEISLCIHRSHFFLNFIKFFHFRRLRLLDYYFLAIHDVDSLREPGGSRRGRSLREFSSAEVVDGVATLL